MLTSVDLSNGSLSIYIPPSQLKFRAYFLQAILSPFLRNITFSATFKNTHIPKTKMKKVVLKLMFADEKIKQKAMEKVSGFSGVESIAMDSNNKQLTVTGDVDPVCVVDKLRKLCQVEIVSVGPAKEPEKEKPKEKPADEGKDYMAQYLKAHEEYYKKQQLYYNFVQPFQPTYYATTVEENPNGCVIC